MSTTLLGLPTYTGPNLLSAATWNKAMQAEDNIARALAAALNKGVVSGWQLSTTKSTVTSGHGVVGGGYARTTASQVISGLANGRNYVFAKADGGTPASQTVDFVARTTSAAITNPDGITYATRLGYLQRTAGVVSGVTNSGNAGFPRDKLLQISANKAVLPGGAKLYTSGGTSANVVMGGSLRALGNVLHLGTDTYLARSGANTLVTSDPLRVAGSLHVATSAHVAGSGANTAKWRGNLKVSGTLTVTNDALFLGAGSGHPYGDIHCNGITWANGAVASQTWRPISTASWIANQTNLTTLTGNAGLKVTNAGRYLCNWAASVRSNSAAVHIEMGPMIGAASQSYGRILREVHAANVEDPLGGVAILSLTAGQIVKLGLKCTDAPASCTVTNANLALTMVGG